MSRRRSRATRRTRTLVCALSAVVALGGCNGSDPGADPDGSVGPFGSPMSTAAPVALSTLLVTSINGIPLTPDDPEVLASGARAGKEFADRAAVTPSECRDAVVMGASLIGEQPATATWRQRTTALSTTVAVPAQPVNFVRLQAAMTRCPKVRVVQGGRDRTYHFTITDPPHVEADEVIGFINRVDAPGRPRSTFVAYAVRKQNRVAECILVNTGSSPNDLLLATLSALFRAQAEKL